MPRLSQAESRERTRSRILDAAGKVFAEQGFAAARLEEIAENAGYTRGALYYNFADKDELFLAVLDDRLQADIGVISDLIKSSEDPVQLVQALRDRPAAGRKSAAEARRWVQLCDEFRLYALKNESARKRLAEHQQHLRDAYTRGITGVLRRIDVSPPAPPEQLAIMIMALDDGIIRQKRVDPAAVPEGLFFDLLALLIRAAKALHETSQNSPATD